MNTILQEEKVNKDVREMEQEAEMKEKTERKGQGENTTKVNLSFYKHTNTGRHAR